MSEQGKKSEDTTSSNVSASLGALHGAGVWRRRVHELLKIAGWAKPWERQMCSSMVREHRLQEAACFGESMGHLFRALELAYDNGFTHGRKVSP